MSLKGGPVIRNDDVCQVITSTTAHQRQDLGDRTLFEAFLDGDAPFAKYNYTCILAVLSEGLNNDEWVEHIQNNKERYNIQLHGLDHRNYAKISEYEAYERLAIAKNDIEGTFPPFGRKGTPSWGHKVCAKLGIEMYTQIGKVDAKFWLKNPEDYPHVNFHYWNEQQVEHVTQILQKIHE